MSLSYNNSILAQTISVSGVNTNVSGVLQINNIDVSVSGHTHSGNDIISGTINNDRLSGNAQASMNLYLWANFR
jgi:hypothetical protein